MRRPVVMGNWKLNGSKAMVTELLTGLNAELEGVEGVDVAVAPPALYIDIIIGHSERREYHNESDEFVAKKFKFLQENGLKPVFCIGESEAQNEAGETEAVCARQINAVIDAYGVEALNGAIIAYEPIWAIGTGKAATAEDAQRIHASIRAMIAEKDAAVAEQVIIQYGGSVKPENAEAYFAQPDIDGALVGGAALNAAGFAAIAKAAAKAKA
ncbi:triose-phosphate isomerase [Vibrio fortis]